MCVCARRITQYIPVALVATGVDCLLVCRNLARNHASYAWGVVTDWRDTQRSVRACMGRDCRPPSPPAVVGAAYSSAHYASCTTTSSDDDVRTVRTSRRFTDMISNNCIAIVLHYLCACTRVCARTHSSAHTYMQRCIMMMMISSAQSALLSMHLLT